MINIVGGAGFVGSALSRILCKDKSENFSIIDIVQSPIYPQNTIKADVRLLEQLRASLVNDSTLINLAAEHKDNVSPKSLYNDVNVEGAKNLCLIAREKNIRKIIFTSSVAIYGFAPLGTDESGTIAPFNEYGRTKWEAEKIYKQWQEEDPLNRTLIIIRPTVIFGERNRGNVFNLLQKVASGKFVMIGNGLNRKSMAYVENVASFIQFSLRFKQGVHIFNYIDKPDFTMNQLVSEINKLLGRSITIKLRIPFYVGLLIGYGFDIASKISGRRFSISSIRVKKFCTNSIFESAINSTEFIPPFSLLKALENTVKYEFIEDNRTEKVFYSE